MGCGCAGSTPPRQNVVSHGPAATAEQRRTDGGPGTPGYTWNGPLVASPQPREESRTPARAAE